jgi:hypothetical protein
MNGCQGSLINLGGRRELVKTVLSSLLVYLLTVIMVPKSFSKSLISCADVFFGLDTRSFREGSVRLVGCTSAGRYTAGGSESWT